MFPWSHPDLGEGSTLIKTQDMGDAGPMHSDFGQIRATVPTTCPISTIDCGLMMHLSR